MKLKKKLMEFFPRESFRSHLTLVAVAMLLMAGCTDFLEPPLHSDRDSSRSDPRFGQTIPGEYIVVFKDGVTDIPGLARQLVESQDGEINHIYQYAIKGFAATLSSEAVEALRRHPQIAWIEEDKLVWTDELETTGGQWTDLKTGAVGDPDFLTDSWGLDRIDQRDLPLDSRYTYNLTGNGVNVYVISTGIYYGHDEFEGRAIPGHCYEGGDGSDTDGGGTMLAAIAGGKTLGVAKDVTLISVRVLPGGRPRGGRPVTNPTANIIAGIDWVTKDHTENNSGNYIQPAVAVMNIISNANETLDAAILESINAGVTYVVPVVDGAMDCSCAYALTGLKETITVGATDESDTKWADAKDSECITLFAPGVSVTSASRLGEFDTREVTSNSAAAAFAAGVTALYLEQNTEASPAKVMEAMIDAATIGRVNYIAGYTPNRLLFSRAWGGPYAFFAVDCVDLKCTFTCKSEGEIVEWYWNFGDEYTSDTRNPTHTYAAAGIYTVTLTVTDNEGATGTASQVVTVIAEDNGGEEPPPPSDPDILLVVDLRIAGRNAFADLVWSGTTAASVDIYRDGEIIDTISNSGSYSERLRDKGTYLYKVCEAGTDICSNTAEVTF